ncbi:MAG TPA: acyltransferase domain-containing protein [Kofleriaceae bacterium]|nr:acyltransferase domain-containing protein [Kofleriaceae bacterium]
MIDSAARDVAFAPARVAAGDGAAYALPLTARSPEALRQLAAAYRDVLRDAMWSLHDVCLRAASRRVAHDHRVIAIGTSRDELADALDGYVGTGGGLGVTTSPGAVPRPARGPVFVFSGMGPQWWGMGQQLWRDEPVFRAVITQCDAVMRRFAPWSLIDEMTRDEASSRIADVEISQPANFALQVALAALWRSWGVVPSAVVGHSIGEVAAVHVAGVLDLEEACRVIVHASRLQQRLTGAGRIAAVGLGEAEAEARIAAAGLAGAVEVAAVNSPASVSLAGDTAALEALQRQIAASGVFARMLPFRLPFHSHLMEPIRDELLATLADLRTARPRLALYSTVVGGAIAEVAIDHHYWWRNVRQTVRFSDAIAAIAAVGHDVFLEIGPHPVLGSLISDAARARKKPTVVASLRRHSHERRGLLGSLASLYALGFAVDWHGVYPDGGRATSLRR